MIFVTLGSQKFPFDRLLKAIDLLIERQIIKEKVFAQIGYSTHVPKNYEYQKFLDKSVFDQMLEAADIVITHGGTGAIIGTIKKHKKVIAVPRLAQFGEHVDDHQMQIVSQFGDMELICACTDIGRLDKALLEVTTTDYKEYVSNTKAIIRSIDTYIDMFGKGMK